MLQLNPINKSIRKELHFREASIAKTVLHGAKDSVTSKSNELAADFYPLGTVWIKMTSPVEDKKNKSQGAVMLGGEMLDPDGDQSFSKMKHGFNEMYTQPITDGEGEMVDSPFRPLAGVKGLSSTYAGGMKAIRNATVNWTCYSLADLDRLTPYFLSHGTTVLLEWGWTSDTIKGKEFTMEQIKEGQCYTNIQNKIFENGGNYDAMCGIIKNYTWTLRDDGGFDCVTDITSLGVSMIDNKVKQTLDLDYTTMEKKVVTEGDTTTTYAIVPKVTMPKYIKDLSNQLEKYAAKNPKGVLKMEKEGNLLHSDADIGPYVTWGWMEDNIISKFLSKVNESKGIILSDMRSIIDGKSVIITNHDRLLTTDRKSFILPGQWPAEHIEDTTLAEEINRAAENIPDAERTEGETEPELSGWKLKIVQSLGLDKLADALTELLATGKAAVTALVEGSFIGDDFHEGITRALAAKVIKDYDNFAVSDNPNDGGYLRNILLHWETIVRAFGDVGTVEAGLKNLFTEINRDMNLWDFSITNDQNNTGRMMVIDLNYVNASVGSLLDDESRFEDGEVQGRLFKFKTWKEDTLTKAQTMEAKLPSAMAMAAMYGRNTGGEGVGEEDPSGEGAGAAFKNKKDPILGPMKQGWKFKNFGLLDPNTLVKEQGLDGKEVWEIPPITLDKGPELGALTPDDSDEVVTNVESKSTAQKKTVSPDVMSDTEFTELIGKINNLGAEDPNTGEKSTLPAKLHIYNQFGNMHDHIMKKMKALIHGEPGTDEKPSKAKQDTLVPIDLSITLDGIGGIYPGNVFTSDYLPEVYKRTCVFQVKSLEHTVSAEGWDVGITGQIRVALGKIGDAIKEMETEK